MNEFHDTIDQYFASKNYQYTNADSNVLQILFDQIDQLESKLKKQTDLEIDSATYKSQYDTLFDSQQELTQKYQINLNDYTLIKNQNSELTEENGKLTSENNFFAKTNRALSSDNQILTDSNQSLNKKFNDLTETKNRFGSQLEYLKTFLNWQEDGSEPP